MNAKRHTLANALRVAAESYAVIAKDFTKVEGHERVAKQFEEQALAALDMALEIEQAETIRLED